MTRILAAIAAAAALMWLVGCATLPPRDCYLDNITILWRDHATVQMAGEATRGPGRYYRGVSTPAARVVMVEHGDADALEHEVEHLCARSPEEHAAIDGR